MNRDDHNHIRRRDSPPLILVGAFTAVLATSPLQAGPIDPVRHPDPDHAQAVHDAEHAVDDAWDIYHRAALGGTIASPALQATIEEHLHEARALVAQVQEAADREDTGQVRRLVHQIKRHASHAIQGSKEHKQ